MALLLRYDPKLDWAANFAQMLGVNDDPGFKEAVRALEDEILARAGLAWLNYA